MHGSGSPGTVRQKHAVGLQRQHIFRLRLRRNHRDLAAFAAQLAQNVLLDAEVVGDYMKALRLVFHSDHFFRQMRTLAGFPDIGVIGGDYLGQVGSIHLRKRSRLRDQFVGVSFKCRDDSAHHAVVAQMTHQRARVDIASTGILNCSRYSSATCCERQLELTRENSRTIRPSM